MKGFSHRHGLVGLAMVLAALLAFGFTPREMLAEKGQKVDLEAMIPQEFGDWQMDRSVLPLMANPELDTELNKIYNQILSRTYINSHGERIMLSIAYGGDQRDSMQVHKPEVCYPAQGFQILQQVDGKLDTGFGEIPARRLVASQGARIEPITYWIRIGELVAISSTQWKLEQMKYGLSGRIPDGLLFRISSIQSDTAVGYKTQQDFIRVLMEALSPRERQLLIGQTFPTSIHGKKQQTAF